MLCYVCLKMLNVLQIQEYILNSKANSQYTLSYQVHKN